MPTTQEITDRLNSLSVRQSQIREYVAKATESLAEWNAEGLAVDAEILNCQSWLSLQVTYEENKQDEIFAKDVPSE